MNIGNFKFFKIEIEYNEINAMTDVAAMI